MFLGDGQDGPGSKWLCRLNLVCMYTYNDIHLCVYRRDEMSLTYICTLERPKDSLGVCVYIYM